MTTLRLPRTVLLRCHTLPSHARRRDPLDATEVTREMALLDLQGLKSAGTRWGDTNKPSALSLLACDFKSSLSILLCPK